MSRVKILDKTFETSIPEAVIKSKIQAVADRINRDYEGKNPLLLAVLNGAIIFASDLMRCLTIPCEISFVKLASYQGTTSTGRIKEVIGINEDLNVTTLKKDKPSETVTVEVELTEEKPMAPINEGDVVGQLVAYDNGEEVASQDLVSLETSGKGGILSYIGFADEDRYQFFILLGIFILILIIIIRGCRARKRRKESRQ